MTFETVCRLAFIAFVLAIWLGGDLMAINPDDVYPW